MNRTVGFFIVIIGLPALLLFVGAQPEARVVPYYALMLLFWSLWLVPVALIVLLVQLFRKRGAARGDALTTVAGGYLTVVLALALYLGIWGGQQSSMRYEQIGGVSPYHLEARVMAGSNNVSLGIREFEAPGVTEGTIVTAPAAAIAAVNKERGVGESYTLRLIAASPDVTWTVEPGEGVELVGDPTIPPGTYRDFNVTTSAGTATLKSGGTGRCPLDRDPNDCRR
jgi:hypothetical protein